MIDLAGKVDAPEAPSPVRVELPETTAADLAEARTYSMVFAWSPEDAAWLVSFPEFPGVRTHGATIQEAAAMAEDAISLAIAADRFNRRTVPVPPRTARRFVVTAAPSVEAADLRALRDARNISQQLLAGLLNVSDSTVQSWEQGRKQPDGAALRLLQLYQRHPDLLEELIEAKPSAPPPS